MNQQCRFFAIGKCNKGSSCPFKHEIQVQGAPPLCRYFAFGGCTRGDKCPFKHVKQDRICRLYVSGQCTKGESCTFEHSLPYEVKLNADLEKLQLMPSSPNSLTNKGPAIAPVTPKAKVQNSDVGTKVETLTKPFGSSMSVTFGTGASVTCLVTNDTSHSTRIAIHNIPKAYAQETCIRKLVINFGTVNQIQVITNAPGETLALVTFDSPIDAASARVALDGGPYPTSPCENPQKSKCCLQVRAVSVALKDTSTVNSSTLKVSWYRPSRSAYVNFYEFTRAAHFVPMLDGASFRGSQLTCICTDSNALKIGGLPENTNKYQLMKFVLRKVRSIQYVDEMEIELVICESPFTQSDAIRIISKLLKAFGPLESFTLIDDNNNRKTVAAFAKLARSGDAVQAQLNLHNQKQPELRNNRLFVERYFTCKFRVMLRMHSALIDDFNKLRLCFEQCPVGNAGEVASVTFKHFESGDEVGVSNNRVTWKLSSCNVRLLAQAKNAVESLLAGEPILDDQRRVVWHTNFSTPEGLAYLNGLNGFIYRDLRTMALYVYGQNEALKSALKASVMEYLQKLRIQSLPITRLVLGKVLRFGLQTFATLIGGIKNISLDITKLIIHFEADEPGSVEKATKWLSSDAKFTTSNEMDSSTTCPVCFCEPDVPVQMIVCEHVYCTECICHFLNQGVHSGVLITFPLKCAAEGCDCPISLSTIRSLLSINDMDSLFNASLRAHVQRNPKTLFYCPTPDCSEIFEYNDQIGDNVVQECTACLQFICTRCRVTAHEGLTCAEYNDACQNPDVALFNKFKQQNDVRSCPNQGCSAPIMKNGGCNHMTCSVCKAHICWVCMNVFGKEEIYNHMRIAHGGIGV